MRPDVRSGRIAFSPDAPEPLILDNSTAASSIWLFVFIFYVPGGTMVVPEDGLPVLLREVQNEKLLDRRRCYIPNVAVKLDSMCQRSPSQEPRNDGF